MCFCLEPAGSAMHLRSSMHGNECSGLSQTSMTVIPSLVCGSYPHQLPAHCSYDAIGAALEEAYQAAITAGANPRIVLINSPSNPTGRAFSPSTVSEIVEFCSSRGIILISDEIYSDLRFSPWDPQMSPFTRSKGEACIIMTGGLSKVS